MRAGARRNKKGAASQTRGPATRATAWSVSANNSVAHDVRASRKAVVSFQNAAHAYAAAVAARAAGRNVAATSRRETTAAATCARVSVAAGIVVRGAGAGLRGSRHRRGCHVDRPRTIGAIYVVAAAPPPPDDPRRRRRPLLDFPRGRRANAVSTSAAQHSWSHA